MIFKNFFIKASVVIEHDVEAIIASFTSTVTKLERAAEVNLAAAEAHTKAAVHYEQLADAAHTASEKATKVAEQIKALVS
jgi:hypothetical protein